MKKKMSLTAKIYLIEFLSGMIFYGLGVFFMTPPTNPAFVKYIGVGSLLLVLATVVIGAILTNSERLDERAVTNFYKASNTVVLIVLIFLLVAGGLTYALPVNLKLSPGLIAFSLATILVVHSTMFRALEVAGK